MAHGYRPLISKIRCMNPYRKGTKKSNYNLLHYIATREGVDLTNVNTLQDIVNDNLDISDKGEDILYSDAENDVYLKYIANRPRSHGLFGNINTEQFSDVAKKINDASQSQKNIYRGIISLSSLDAKALGYTTAAKWKTYLESIMPDVANALNLSPNNITWVAAFHAEDSHPHVHYMLWENSEKIHSSFIHVSQQNACREICQNAMFTKENEAIIREITEAERKELYAIQNQTRNKITEYVSLHFKEEIVPGAEIENLPERMSKEEHEQLMGLYKHVIDTLPGKGRIAYQFMPEDNKAYIDRITDMYLNRPDIKKEYKGYLDAVGKIHELLGKTKGEVNAQKNISIKELYNRVGNIVLKGAIAAENSILCPDEDNSTGDIMSPVNNADVEITNDSGDIVSLDNYADENVQAEVSDTMSLAQTIKTLIDENSPEYNPEKAEKIILEELGKSNDISLKLALGKLYSNIHSELYNSSKAIFLLNSVLEEMNNNFDAALLLGNIYSFKQNLEYDPEKAEQYYKRALSIRPTKTNFIKLKLSRMYADKDNILFSYEKAVNVLASASDYVGSVSLQLGNISKQQGQLNKVMEYYKKSADNKIKRNAYAAYQYGKLILKEDKEAAKAYLSIAQEDVPRASMLLADIYQKEERYEEAVASYENVYKKILEAEKKKFYLLSNEERLIKSEAALQLGKIYSDEKANITDKEKGKGYYWESIKILESIEEDRTGNISAKLGEIYLNRQAPFYDVEKAIHYLKRSADKGNVFAEYKISSILLDYKAEYYDFQKGIIYLNKAVMKEYMPAVMKAGFVYSSSKYGVYNPDKASQYLKAVLRSGMADENGRIALQIGILYSDRTWSQYNMAKAVELFEEAAEKENAYAALKLAKCYQYGIGVKRDLDKSREWMQRAVTIDKEYEKYFENTSDNSILKSCSYSLLRQVFSSMAKAKNKESLTLLYEERMFKTHSKQVQKEEYLHKE